MVAERVQDPGSVASAACGGVATAAGVEVGGVAVVVAVAVTRRRTMRSVAVISAAWMAA